jgi:restriction endonuclease/Holliday junction DNA resolvase RuvB-like protein
MKDRVWPKRADAGVKRIVEDPQVGTGGSGRQSSGFASIVGQREVIQRLKEFAALYLQSGRGPAHVLLTGIAGIGKRTVGRAFAVEYCHKYVETDAGSLARTGDLMGVVTNLADGDALLVTDIAKTPKSVMLSLVLVLTKFSFDFVADKGMFAKTVTVPLKRFTCLGTALSKAKCPPELIDAFPLILPLQTYSQAELAAICERLGQRKGLTITPDAADLVAATSAGTPHHVEVLVDRLIGLGRTTISAEDVGQISSLIGLSTGSVGTGPPCELDTLSGIDFEKAVAAVLRAIGFRTEMTEVTGDGGVDIVASLDRPLIGGRYLIQCKRFAPGKLISAGMVRDFYGALTADRQAVKGIFITTSGFTSQAVAFARGIPVELIDGQQLQQLLAQYGISTEAWSTPPKLFE